MCLFVFVIEFEVKSSEVLHLLKTWSFLTLIVDIASHSDILLLKWNETPFIASGNKQTMQEAYSSFGQSIPFAFFWNYYLILHVWACIGALKYKQNMVQKWMEANGNYVIIFIVSMMW